MKLKEFAPPGERTASTQAIPAAAPARREEAPEPTEPVARNWARGPATSRLTADAWLTLGQGASLATILRDPSAILTVVRDPALLRELTQTPAALAALLRRPKSPEATRALLQLFSNVRSAFAHKMEGRAVDRAFFENNRALLAPTPELSRALRAMTPSATDVLNELAASPGYTKLSAAEKATFTKRASNNSAIGESIRRELHIKLSESGFVAAAADRQATELRTFLADGGVPSVVSINLDDPAHTPTFDIGAGQEAPRFAFSSKVADARIYPVTVGSTRITVTVATAHDDFQPTIDEVARGLASLPSESLKVLKSVFVEPARNPEDAHWAMVYARPDFRAYMTAGSAGDVRIYPSSSKTSQGFLNGSLIHETGHTISKQRFGENSGADAGWADWQKASEIDEMNVSLYAKASLDEDFAETLALYQLTRGTPEHAQVRALFSARFGLLDRLLGARS